MAPELSENHWIGLKLMFKQTAIHFEYACLLTLLIYKSYTVAIICGNTSQMFAFVILSSNILFFKKGSSGGRAPRGSTWRHARVFQWERQCGAGRRQRAGGDTLIGGGMRLVPCSQRGGCPPGDSSTGSCSLESTGKQTALKESLL